MRIFERFSSRNSEAAKRLAEEVDSRTTGYLGHFVLLRGFEGTPRNIAKELLKGTAAIRGLIDNFLRRSDSRSVRHILSALHHDMLTPRPRSTKSVDLTRSEELLPRFSIVIPTRDRLELLIFVALKASTVGSVGAFGPSGLALTERRSLENSSISLSLRSLSRRESLSAGMRPAISPPAAPN
jgi:hypothetical protein